MFCAKMHQLYELYIVVWYFSSCTSYVLFTYKYVNLFYKKMFYLSKNSMFKPNIVMEIIYIYSFENIYCTHNYFGCCYHVYGMRSMHNHV